MERLVFATYSVKLSERGTDATLSSFDEGKDLLKVVHKFFEEIYDKSFKTSEVSGKYKIHFRLEDRCEINLESRSVYGILSSGVSGEEYKIHELESDELIANVSKGDGAFRDVFFYFYIPPQRKTGYLILERKPKFGVKTVLTPSLNRYLKNRDLNSFTVKLFNIVNDDLYRKMMNEGKLQKVELIKKSIPKDLEKYMKNGEVPDEINGTLRTSIMDDKLPDDWKTYIRKLFLTKGKSSDQYEIDGIDDQYSELEFQLELNGRKKTFFVVHQSRIQPDVDVSKDYNNKFGSELILENLASLAQNVIDEIVQIQIGNG